MVWYPKVELRAMSDESDDEEMSFNLPRESIEPAPKGFNAPSSSSDPSSLTSSDSSSSSSSPLTTQPPPPKRRKVKGTGKGQKSGKGSTGSRGSASKPCGKRAQKEEKTLPEIKLSSVAALGWAKRICDFSYQKGGKCHYDHIDVITEFTGSSCVEAAVESIVSHMDPKPALNFCYSADVKPGCRKVAMTTRLDLGCTNHSKHMMTNKTPKTCSSIVPDLIPWFAPS